MIIKYLSKIFDYFLEIVSFGNRYSNIILFHSPRRLLFCSTYSVLADHNYSSNIFSFLINLPSSKIDCPKLPSRVLFHILSFSSKYLYQLSDYYLPLAYCKYRLVFFFFVILDGLVFCINLV